MLLPKNAETHMIYKKDPKKTRASLQKYSSKSVGKKPRLLSGFSPRFNQALSETLMIEAMMRADGSNLDEFVESPISIQEIYHFRALAAQQEMQENQAQDKIARLTPPKAP
jgi:hypothetical protein